jgi:hypothetical protein
MPQLAVHGKEIIKFDPFKTKEKSSPTLLQLKMLYFVPDG